MNFYCFETHEEFVPIYIMKVSVFCLDWGIYSFVTGKETVSICLRSCLGKSKGYIHLIHIEPKM